MGRLPWLSFESESGWRVVGSMGLQVSRVGSYGRYAWAYAEVVNVWDWLEADGEVEARSIIEDLDDRF